MRYASPSQSAWAARLVNFALPSAGPNETDARFSPAQEEILKSRPVTAFAPYWKVGLHPILSNNRVRHSTKTYFLLQYEMRWVDICHVWTRHPFLHRSTWGIFPWSTLFSTPCSAGCWRLALKTFFAAYCCLTAKYYVDGTFSDACVMRRRRSWADRTYVVCFIVRIDLLHKAGIER